MEPLAPGAGAVLSRPVPHAMPTPLPTPAPHPTHLHAFGMEQATLALLALVALLQRKQVAAVARLIWTDYRSVAFCFLALTAFAVAVGFYADGTTADTAGFWSAAVASVFASLVENLIFFSLLGFGLLVVQRREADRNRGLDDKIGLLFNGKNLRGGEGAFLREELRKISADCQTLEVEVDVLGHDPEAQLVEIDVSRTWLVANYLADESALYSWRLNLSADAAGHSPSLAVYPSHSTALSCGRDGEWRSASDDEMLHPGGELECGETMKAEPMPLTIAPREAREFRTRFQGWQRLHATSAVPAPGANAGPLLPEPDSYRFKVTRHWDEVRLTVRNSLKRPLAVSISQSIGEGERRPVKKLELPPGDRQRHAHRFENLPANSRVYVPSTPGSRVVNRGEARCAASKTSRSKGAFHSYRIGPGQHSGGPSFHRTDLRLRVAQAANKRRH